MHVCHTLLDLNNFQLCFIYALPISLFSLKLLEAVPKCHIFSPVDISACFSGKKGLKIQSQETCSKLVSLLYAFGYPVFIFPQ
jgi:hypothetical protein